MISIEKHCPYSWNWFWVLSVLFRQLCRTNIHACLKMWNAVGNRARSLIVPFYNIASHWFQATMKAHMDRFVSSTTSKNEEIRLLLHTVSNTLEVSQRCQQPLWSTSDIAFRYITALPSGMSSSWPIHWSRSTCIQRRSVFILVLTSHSSHSSSQLPPSSSLSSCYQHHPNCLQHVRVHPYPRPCPRHHSYCVVASYRSTPAVSCRPHHRPRRCGSVRWCHNLSEWLPVRLDVPLRRVTLRP